MYFCTIQRIPFAVNFWTNPLFRRKNSLWWIFGHLINVLRCETSKSKWLNISTHLNFPITLFPTYKFKRITEVTLKFRRQFLEVHFNANEGRGERRETHTDAKANRSFYYDSVVKIGQPLFMCAKFIFCSHILWTFSRVEMLKIFFDFVFLRWVVRCCS